MELYPKHDFRELAMTVKTFDNELYVNLYDGTFLKKNGQKPLLVVVNSDIVYQQAKTVRINQRIIARRRYRNGTLYREKEPIKLIER